jgi:sulfur relay (sulfurtransferase) complex TusBCD TusD component (DsrE family)
VFLLIGMAMGAFGGALVGRAEAETDTHLYVEGVRHGDAVLLVWADERRTAQAMNVLRQSGALGVSICTRARQALAPLDNQTAQPV